MKLLVFKHGNKNCPGHETQQIHEKITKISVLLAAQGLAQSTPTKFNQDKRQ